MRSAPSTIAIDRAASRRCGSRTLRAPADGRRRTQRATPSAGARSPASAPCPRTGRRAASPEPPQPSAATPRASTASCQHDMRRRRAAGAVPGARAVAAAAGVLPPPRRNGAIRCASSGRWMPDGRFTIDSAEFIALMGPRTAALLGQPWPFIASVTRRSIPRARSRARSPRGPPGAAYRCTGASTAATSGLRSSCRACRCSTASATFRGYRGFGVCRDVARLNAIAQARQAARRLRRSSAGAPSSAVGASLPPETDAPGLTPVERYAFYELSRQLTSRINEADAHAAQRSRQRPMRRQRAGPGAVTPPIAEPRGRPSRRSRTRRGRSSTGCRSACWSTGSAICSTPTRRSWTGPAATASTRWRKRAGSTA